MGIGQQSENQVMYGCSRCGHAYKQKYNRDRHEKYECVGIQPQFKCDQCLFISKYKRNLDKHMKRKHSEIGIKNDSIKDECQEDMF